MLVTRDQRGQTGAELLGSLAGHRFLGMGQRQRVLCHLMPCWSLIPTVGRHTGLREPLATKLLKFILINNTMIYDLPSS